MAETIRKYNKDTIKNLMKIFKMNLFRAALPAEIRNAIA